MFRKKKRMFFVSELFNVLSLLLSSVSLSLYAMDDEYTYRYLMCAFMIYVARVIFVVDWRRKTTFSDRFTFYWLGSVCICAVCIIFGSPLWPVSRMFVGTLLFSAHLSSFIVLPLHPWLTLSRAAGAEQEARERQRATQTDSDSDDDDDNGDYLARYLTLISCRRHVWQRFGDDAARASVKSLCAIVGGWMGAFLLPLDWDRPWQAWPVPCVFSSTVGYIVGIAVSLALFGSRNRKLD
jgi:GPI biosynthesis protein family Pig-F